MTTGERRQILSDALVIAAAPAIAYACAYAYESGYATSYGIPLQLVSIDLRTVLVMGAALIAAHAILAPVLHFVPSRPAKALFSIVFWGGALATMYWLVWLITAQHWILRLVVLAVVSLPALGFFGELRSILFKKQLGKTWVDRWERLRAVATHADALRQQRSLLNDLYQVVDPSGRLIRAGLGFMVLVGILRLLGLVVASTEHQFLVSQTKPPLAMLRRYGDIIVAAPFDSTTKRLENRFVLMHLVADSASTWHLERIGPLSGYRPKVNK